MIKPKPPGTPIDAKRIDSWVNLFSGYRHSISSREIENWLGQFDRADVDLAARLLDCVEFVSHDQIITAYKSILTSLTGWHANVKKRQGKWRFVAFSGSAGESGDSMLHLFRRANNLSHRKYSELFIYRSDLLSAHLKAEDKVVFVDDFSGTGDQVCEAWGETLELLPGNPTVILSLVRVRNRARKRIQLETDISVHPYLELQDRDNIFSQKCKYFSETEKNAIHKYCLRADKKNPKGYSDCGLVLVFAHKCPNNSIPILHSNSRKWRGLFL
jgi:hypothetical protein